MLNGWPGTFFLTLAQFASFGSFERSAGTVTAGVQGPLTGSGATNHDLPSSRKYLELFKSMNKSQLVLMAHMRRVSFTGLNWGWPMKMTMIAGTLLWKIGGGCIFSSTRGTFTWSEFIWARIRSRETF